MRTRLTVAIFSFAAASSVAHVAAAQTVANIAARGQCSTAGVEGISSQMVNTQICMRPTIFVRATPHANVTLTSSRIHPLMSVTARDALWTASRSVALQINSMFRPVSEQYVLYNSGGCGLVARVGTSNHQSGRALDVNNWSAARTALQRAGCVWLGSSDTVHFDCPGTDYRPDSIRAFQRLWNVNHPADHIAEDGSYGPITDSRLARSPAAGFPLSGCMTMTRPDAGTDAGRDAGVRDASVDASVDSGVIIDGGANAQDTDDDGVPDDMDNCVTVANPSQIDVDEDGIGDECDPVDDRDMDGGMMMNPDPTMDRDADIDGGGDIDPRSMPGCGCAVPGGSARGERSSRAALVAFGVIAAVGARRRRGVRGR